MPVTTYTTQGTPADTLGVQGDMAIDYQGRFLWGPKGASSWAGTAISIVGPTGPAGATPALPVMANTASAWGQGAYFSGAMSNSTSAANVALSMPGTTIPHTFTPTVNTALTGVQATNFGATGATVYFYLTNITTGQDVYGYNGGNGIASGTVASADYAATLYPLLANNTYQWRAIRGAAGNGYLNITPKYLAPCGAINSVSYYPNMVQPSSINVPANTGVYLQTASIAGQTGYYRSSSASYMYQITTTLTGSGPAAIYTYNGSAGANHWATAPRITLTSTPTTYVYGPFGYNEWPFTPNQFYQIGIYASGGALTLTQATSTLQVAM